MKRKYRLRAKVTLGIVATLFVVLTAMLIILNRVLLKEERREARELLEYMAQNDGHVPSYKQMPPMMRFFSPSFASSVKSVDGFPLRLETVGLRNCFAVRVQSQYKVLEIINDFPLLYDRTEIPELMQDIFEEGKPWGRIDGIHFLIVQKENDEQLVCIADLQNELLVYRHLNFISLEILLVTIAVVSVFSWFLAGVIIKPSLENYNRQKAFISNAGHELRTPISVIGANIDVLLSDFPNNKWLQYIKDENERMGELVKDLLYLARTDAEQRLLEICPFDFSTAVEGAVLPFESVIFEQQKTLHTNIEKNLVCNGDEHQIRQLVAILVDNAIKNSEKGAIIRVSAYQDGKNDVVKVYNTGIGIQEDELEKIFERFYRSDSSRSRNTGGYGLGLPIALTIAEAHHGALTATSTYGEWAEFTLTLPKSIGGGKKYTLDKILPIC